MSHLFLPAAKTKVQPRFEDPAFQQPADRRATRTGVAVLRQGSGLTKDQLIATLGECQDALESGMGILGSGVPCTPYGAIDVLALDCVHQLTVVTVGTAPG